MTGQEIISSDAKNKIKDIHALSQKYNCLVEHDHTTRLLELMQKHNEEIEELINKNDPHAFVETGDLIILCFELLLEHGYSLDKILETGFSRYDKKLKTLLAEQINERPFDENETNN